MASKIYYSCVAPGCNYNSKNPGKIEAQRFGLVFHLFPKNETLRNEWLVNLGKPEYKVVSTSRICSCHFTPQSFEKNPLAFVGLNISDVPNPRRLNRDAVPTLFGEHSIEIIPAPTQQNVEMENPSDSDLMSVSDDRDSLVPDFASTSRLTHNLKDFTSRPSKRGKSLESSILDLPTWIKKPDKSVGLQTLIRLPTHSKSCQVAMFPRRLSKESQTLWKRKHIFCQATPQMVDKSTQMVFFEENVQDFMKSRCEDDQYDYEIETDDDGAQVDPLDISYTPSEISSDDIKSSRKFQTDFDVIKASKFIVFEAALLQLFIFCSQCLLKCTNISTSIKGSMITVHTECPNNHKLTWNSQPEIGRKPALNVLIAAGILFSGLNPAKALRMLKFSGVKMFDLSTYYRMQRAFLWRAIKNAWDSEQQALLISLQGTTLKLGGDGRFDSPGHSAKYLSYCFLESSIKKIIHLVLIQSNQVKSSVAMELEGLKQGIKYLLHKGFVIGSIVTDRHISIRAFLKKTYPKIKHLFDCWHLVKSVKSKIASVCGKKKYMEVLLAWSKSVQNHLYWLAATCDGNGQLMAAKWESLLNHVINKHEGHSGPYEACEHGSLDNDRRKRWLIPISHAYTALEKIVLKLSKDVAQVSSACQTSSVEAFHAVVIQFAPKHTHYSYFGMMSRLLLAALHFNENSSKMQATTVNGTRRWNIFFPKFKKSEYSLRPIMEASTYDYVNKIMSNAIEYSEETYETGLKKTESVLGLAPKSVCSEYAHPTKEEALTSYALSRRFSFE